MSKILVIIFLFIGHITLFSQTIENKKESFFYGKDGKELHTFLDGLNKELHRLKNERDKKYEKVSIFHANGAQDEEFKDLLKEINALRFQITNLEKEWRNLSTNELKKDDEGYALWAQEETTFSELIMEYGAQDYLYVIPPDVLAMKIHMHSNIPVPRESWSELLEIILAQNGVGIKQLNPYTRQLYILKKDLIAVDHIFTNPIDLLKIPSNSRIAYIFSPPPERVKGVCSFFERFRDTSKTFIYQVGYKIALISSKEEVEKLLTLYDAVWEKENEKITKVLPTSRIPPQEMEKILKSYFGDTNQKPRLGLIKGEGDDLMIIPLGGEGSLALVGPKNMVEKGEQMIKEIENQIEDPLEMTIYWYTCRHSDPNDVAEVLEKVYTSLISSKIDEKKAPSTPPILPSKFPPPANSESTPPSPHREQIKNKGKITKTHFISYPKTGAIMMVVRRDTLEKIKKLLKKIDVPKKMVEIEVLLFEKRVKNKNNFGMNLLNLGAAASGQSEMGLEHDADQREGIFEFFLSRRKPGKYWPAFDVIHHFLMTQEDITVNAAPLITTLNQTPAEISLVDEISIDEGARPIDTGDKYKYEASYTRKKYGTTMVITPIIHDPEFSDEDKHFVTLETDVKFETIKKTTHNDRPEVSQRHVKNHVCIADGETVILGGLREKVAEDSTNKLPFLGELPGIGKLFGNSKMSDESKEMFIFITPRIISDKKGHLEQMRYQTLIKRPGDLPEFLKHIADAKKRQKARIFSNSVKLLFGTFDG